jgi:hypothetical protein
MRLPDVLFSFEPRAVERLAHKRAQVATIHEVHPPESEQMDIGLIKGCQGCWTLSRGSIVAGIDMLLEAAFNIT